MAFVLHASTTRHEQYGGPRRYIRLVVHDTNADLQRAAAAYRGEALDWSGTAGCFHPADWRERYVDGEWVRVEDPHWAGVLRLSRESLRTEVVVHECLHAAASIYRQDVRARLRLGTGCGPNEETLAYIAGDLTAEVTNVLHAADVWT